MRTHTDRSLRFQDLWADDAPDFVTVVTTSGATVRGTLYGVTEGDRFHRGEVLVQEHGSHFEPTHVPTDRIRAIWAGHGPC